MINLSEFCPERATVLVRCDFDAPYIQDKKIEDDTRIVANIDTLRLLLSRHNRLICIAKHGKPISSQDSKDSLRPVSRYLQSLLPGELVEFIDTPISQLTHDDLSKRSSLVLLENLRYYPQEYENDFSFAKHIASFADWYVNDCFATSHRREASIIGIPQFLPTIMGLHFHSELVELHSRLSSIRRPYVAIIGGAKIAKKMQAVSFFLKECDSVILGGGLANTILSVKGNDMGKSLLDESAYSVTRKVLSQAKKSKGSLLAPIDLRVKTSKGDYVSKFPEELTKMDKVVDIGPITISQIKPLIASAETILWGGPLGYIEDPEGQTGTSSVAENIASDADVIIGGGDTVGFLKDAKLTKPSWYLSTAGGALLSYIEHQMLPGIQAIEDSQKKHSSKLH